MSGTSEAYVDTGFPDELVEIYLAEIDERSGRLVRGAYDWDTEGFVSDRLDGLVRDAHTLKGSSSMMGRSDVAAAAASLERAWKAVRDEDLSPDGDRKEAMETLARLLPSAARKTAGLEALGPATLRLEGMVNGQSAGAAEPESSGAGVSTPEVTVKVERPLVDDDESSFGGLLSSIEGEILGGVTRVETTALYRLINQAVELSLDADALADLTHVSVEGGDPRRMLEAWRVQLERFASSIEDLQASAVALANVPFRETVEAFPQFIRFLGRKLGKDVRFETHGEDVLVDRQIVDLLREPLRHLLVNAVDHGIEIPTLRAAHNKPTTGVVALRAQVVEDRLQVSVSDDGAGIDWVAVEGAARRLAIDFLDGELPSVLFVHGFSTREEPSDFSGHGDGMNLVADALDRVNGGIRVESHQGEGTTVTLSLPVSLVMQNVLVVAAGNHFWGIPEAAVLGTIGLGSAEVRFGEQGRELRFQGSMIPLVSLSDVVGIGESAIDAEAVVITSRGGPVAVGISEVLDRRRVAVKSLGPILEGSHHLTGAALLGGGQVVTVVDHNFIASAARRPDTPVIRHRPRVLVVDDSAGVRQLISATLSGKGFDVEVAPSARAAARAMAEKLFDGLIVDYSMPSSNGVQLVRALRSAGVSLPIIMVSGVADADEQAQAWDAGVDAYLDKSDLRQGALVTTLRQLLDRPGSGDRS